MFLNTQTRSMKSITCEKNYLEELRLPINLDSPRVTIDKSIDFHLKPIEINCQICSMPLSRLEWLQNGRNISNDEHFTITTRLLSMDIRNQQCMMTTLRIYVSELENEATLIMSNIRFFGSIEFIRAKLRSIRMSS